MSQDTNEVRLTGTIERIKPITTKTGAPMAELILKVRQDRFRITAHGNVAEHLLVAAGPGGRIGNTKFPRHSLGTLFNRKQEEQP